MFRSSRFYFSLGIVMASTLVITLLTFSSPSYAQEAQADQNSNTQSSIDGFNGVAWGALYQETFERMKSVAASGERPDFEIVNAVTDKEIVIREGDIVYRYVFYLNPLLKKQAPHDLKTDMDGSQKQDEVQGKFFFAEINFSPVSARDIYQVLQKKYGDRTLSTVSKDSNGAFIWQKDTGYLAQWIMEYEQAPYTRTVYYLSRSISDEIKNDFHSYMFQKELKILQDIIP